MPTRDAELRSQLAHLLRGDQAHMSFADAIADFPREHINTRPAHVPYSFWHLVEHLRITQRDMIEYLTRADYQEMEWPRQYWPAPDADATPGQWDDSVQRFIGDRDLLIAMATDEAVDLNAAVPSHREHTILRGLMIIGNHNSYHTGELAILRQTANAWGPSHQP